MYTTQSGQYEIAYVNESRTKKPGWHFYPNDPDWLAFNHETSFSRAYSSREEALTEAERWEFFEDKITKDYKREDRDVCDEEPYEQ